MRRRTPLVIDDIQPEHCTTDLRLHILRGIPFLAALTDKDIALYGVPMKIVEVGMMF